MEVLIILLPLALFLGGLFLFAFIWSTKAGQYDDLETPHLRMLLDDQKIKTKIETNEVKEKK